MVGDRSSRPNIEEGWQTLADLRQAGTIRDVGASTTDMRAQRGRIVALAAEHWLPPCWDAGSTS